MNNSIKKAFLVDIVSAGQFIFIEFSVSLPSLAETVEAVKVEDDAIP